MEKHEELIRTNAYRSLLIVAHGRRQAQGIWEVLRHQPERSFLLVTDEDWGLVNACLELILEEQWHAIHIQPGILLARGSLQRVVEFAQPSCFAICSQSA